MMMEVLRMENGSMTIEEVLIETGWAAKFETQGEAKGEARGEVRGKIEGKLEVAKNLIKNGFAPEQVAKFSGLDNKTVEGLYRELKE
jgi:predicted transposase/invertase (TIGR01784 family)